MRPPTPQILDFPGDFGFRILDFGFWILDFGRLCSNSSRANFGFWILDFGSLCSIPLCEAPHRPEFWIFPGILDFGFPISDFGFSRGFWILDFGFWIWDLGFWILEHYVAILLVQILDFGFRILDFGLGAFSRTFFGFYIR